MMDKARGEAARHCALPHWITQGVHRPAAAAASARDDVQTVPFGLSIGGNRSCSSAGIVPSTSTTSGGA